MTLSPEAQRRTWHATSQPPRTRWGSLPTTVNRGPLTSLLGLVPHFERRAFVAASPSGQATAANSHLDMVLRSAAGDRCGVEVPVAVVSKRYQLLQHRTVVMLAAEALASVDQSLDIGILDAEIELTEYGERMALHIFLPSWFDFTPDDGHTLGLRLSCFNTVDGSAKFLAAVGWLRFVCANGMVIGEVKSRLHQSHTMALDPNRIEEVLATGLDQAKQDRERIYVQIQHQVNLTQIQQWADTQVAAAWGPVAARRALHIAATGHDAQVFQSPRIQHPSQFGISPLGPVPGAIAPVRNLYDVGQVLTWLARGRRELGERQAWMSKIPELLRTLAA